MGGGYEDDDDDNESRHGAREDARETAAFGKANDGTGTEPEGESEGLIGEGAGNRHDRFGWDAIRAWIGWSKQDCGANGEETREGSSTPGPEATAIVRHSRSHAGTGVGRRRS
jgi:hypothetical protein